MSFALVTGAAKGIGRAIAEELAIRKYHLILVDRDADGLYAITRMLESRYIVQVIPLHIDLTFADGVEQLISFTQPYHEWLNVVVNNPSYGPDKSKQIALHNQLDIIDFNIKALVKIAHTYTPVLKKLAKGYFLNIACTSEAYQFVPALNVCESANAFVLSFTNGLQQELIQSNVQVSCLSQKKATSYFFNNSKKKVAEYDVTSEKLADIASTDCLKAYVI
jgi:short-subunit dehydrogenase